MKTESASRPKARAVTVAQFLREAGASLQLTEAGGAPATERLIREPTVNRPGLLLAGFTRYFAWRRLQVMGNVEMHYLKSLPAEKRRTRLERFCSYNIPGLVLCRGYRADAELLTAATRAGVPVLRSPLVTMDFINQATLRLEDMFAPRSRVMGSMVDILGVGVIIRGESGIGKSECVLALIERGYSLVSDDITQLRLNAGRELMGTSPELTRDHMEVRGIGIINVPAMFGIRSIRLEKKVDLVLDLIPWERAGDIERIGMEQEEVPLMGIPVPYIRIPVRPGRDLARLVEVAAFHIKLRQAGINPAQEIENRVLEANLAPRPAPPAT